MKYDKGGYLSYIIPPYLCTYLDLVNESYVSLQEVAKVLPALAQLGRAWAGKKPPLPFPALLRGSIHYYLAICVELSSPCKRNG